MIRPPAPPPSAHRAGRSLSILQRIAVGNALIILAGAVAGTLLTLHLAGRGVAPRLIVIFAAVGVTLSVAMNAWIVRGALRPLRQLRSMVEALRPGDGGIDTSLLVDSDPDIRALAASLERMYADLTDANHRLHALSGRFIRAQEDERRRLARGLHDETIQAVSGIAMRLDRLSQRLPDDMADVRADLAGTRELALRTLAELRNVVYDLRPSILDDLGLVPAIRSHARSTLESAGVQVDVRGADGDPPLAPDAATALFRIAQEAISNIVRHADARRAAIAVDRGADFVRLTIEDDGRGFTAVGGAAATPGDRHLGLLGIRERAELCGGSVAIASSPGQGTRIVVSLPATVSTGGEDV